MSDAASPKAAGPRGALKRNPLLLVVVAAMCLGLAALVVLLGLPGGSAPSVEERVAAVTAKQPGEYRVLALGDSFTEDRDTTRESTGTNDATAEGDVGSWARVVESRAKADGKELTLYNLAQGGAGPRQYLKNLEDFGLRVQPDLVLIGLSLGDDVLDDGHATQRSPSHYADLLSVKAGSPVPAALERLLSEVAQIEGVCQRLRATCAWLVFPVGLQVHAREHEIFRKAGFETAPWMTAPTPLMAQLLPALKDKGAFVVDALPALQAAGDRPLLRPDDQHLNDDGQRAVGNAAYEALRDAGAFEGQLLRDSSPAGTDGAAVAGARDPRLDALLKGTELEGASDEERRLALKIAALHKLREEMQGILTSLPAKKADAEKMQAEVVALEKDLDPAAVKRVLAEAEARFAKEGAAEGTLLARARGMDEELGRLLENEPPAASDTDTVKALKGELAKQQRATAALGTGTSVAFRALRMLEQMKLALPELRKLKEAKGG